MFFENVEVLAAPAIAEKKTKAPEIAIEGLFDCSALDFVEKNLKTLKATLVTDIKSVIIARAVNESRTGIDSAQEPLAAYATAEARFRGGQACLDMEIAKLSKVFPKLQIKKDSDGQNAVLFNGGEVYFSGRLSWSGSITVDRVATLEGKRAQAVLHALLD